MLRLKKSQFRGSEPAYNQISKALKWLRLYFVLQITIDKLFKKIRSLNSNYKTNLNGNTNEIKILFLLQTLPNQGYKPVQRYIKT